MADFIRSIRGYKASVLGEHEQLYVHCVSSETMFLVPEGLPCVEIECREIHISFLDSLDIRRIAICPSTVNGLKVDEIFADCHSPAMIELHSSCVFQFMDRKDPRQDVNNVFHNVILWEFDVLPSQPSEAIVPQDPVTNDEGLDAVLPPVNLQNQTGCNCCLQPRNPVCLVGVTGHRTLSDVMRESEMDEIRELTETLDLQDSVEEQSGSRNEDGGLNDDNDDADDNDNDNDADGRDVDKREILYPEKFAVVGCWQEQRYQAALASCMWRRSAKLDLQFRVEPEPDNIKDKNALKFSIFHQDKWHVMGYCGVNKIPKLKRAIHRNEVRSISLESLKRTFAPRERTLLYSAALLIVKSGPWDRDDKKRL